jgi:hypothetical protein
LIADIDGDGRAEIVLNYLPADLAEKGGSLTRFGHRGGSSWQ